MNIFPEHIINLLSSSFHLPIDASPMSKKKVNDQEYIIETKPGKLTILLKPKSILDQMETIFVEGFIDNNSTCTIRVKPMIKIIYLLFMPLILFYIFMAWQTQETYILAFSLLIPLIMIFQIRQMHKGAKILKEKLEQDLSGILDLN